MAFDDRSTQGDGGRNLVSPFYSLDKRPPRKTFREELDQERGFMARAFSIVNRFFMIRDRRIAAVTRLAEAIRDFTDPTFLAQGDARWTTTGSIDPATAEGRLTIVISQPEMNSVAGLGAILSYVPYTGRRLSVWDGSQWLSKTLVLGSTPADINVTLLAADTVFDVFAYSTGPGVTDVALETVAWISDTTRATPVTYNAVGVAAKLGDPTRRYLGTFRTEASSMIPVRHLNRFWLWNMYNRIPFSMTSKDSGTWVGSNAAAAWEPMNAGDADWVHDIILGFPARYEAEATVFGQEGGDNGASLPQAAAAIALAVNSTTTPHTNAQADVAENVPTQTDERWRLLRAQLTTEDAAFGRFTIRALGNTFSSGVAGQRPQFSATRLPYAAGAPTVQGAAMVTRFMA